MRLAYTSGPGDDTDRVVRPLGLFFWGTTWSLTAWCELREDFRSFRLDRMREMQVSNIRFPDEPGRTIDDFFRKVDEEE